MWLITKLSYENIRQKFYPWPSLRFNIVHYLKYIRTSSLSQIFKYHHHHKKHKRLTHTAVFGLHLATARWTTTATKNRIDTKTCFVRLRAIHTHSSNSAFFCTRVCRICDSVLLILKPINQYRIGPFTWPDAMTDFKNNSDSLSLSSHVANKSVRTSKLPLNQI